MVFETKQLLKKFCIVEAGWLLIIFLTHSHERPRLVGTDASWTGGPGFRLKMKSNCQRKQQKRNLSYTNKRGSVILDLSSGKYLRKQNLATIGLNKMLRFPVCITAICPLFLTKLQQRNCRCNWRREFHCKRNVFIQRNLLKNSGWSHWTRTHLLEDPGVHHLGHLLIEFGHLRRIHIFTHVTSWN